MNLPRGSSRWLGVVVLFEIEEFVEMLVGLPLLEVLSLKEESEPEGECVYFELSLSRLDWVKGKEGGY